MKKNLTTIVNEKQNTILKKVKSLAVGILLGTAIAGATTYISKNNQANEKNIEKTTIQREVQIGDENQTITLHKENYLTKKNAPYSKGIIESLYEHTTPNDIDLKNILNYNLKIPSGNKEQDAQKILSFVNKFLYTPDSIQYTKSPIETLVEGKGDCEDFSVLAYSMMKSAGLNPVYVVIPPKGLTDLGHILIGVEGNFKGSAVELEGTKYFLAETIGTLKPNQHYEWPIGNSPLYKEFEEDTHKLVFKVN